MSKVPKFILTCIKTEYPHHLIKGTTFKVSGKEVATYMWDDDLKKYGIIGYFGLDCFDCTPVRNFLAARKQQPVKKIERVRPI
jgi:hypothetical protein